MTSNGIDRTLLDRILGESPTYDSLEIMRDTTPHQPWTDGPWTVARTADGGWGVAYDGTTHCTFRRRDEAIRFAEGLIATR